MGKRWKKRRKMLAFAAICATAVMATGTYAWTSISQRQINEKEGTDDAGGRIHDDFNGENKDVYAENYADENGVAVYVRIRLDEYMEIGEDAGKRTYDGEGNLNSRNADPLIAGASIDDTSTWQTRKPADQATSPFVRYWNWIFGGSTVYMPTFDKNKDSLRVDVNGTLQGNGTDGAYSDYHAWSLGESKTADAYYDADENDADEGNQGILNTNYTVNEETHNAAATKTATYMTMEEWIAQGSLVGNYWVWDEDGWFYWARPLRAGETTGLLLDEIAKIDYVDSKYYYAINVVGQFATAGDWGDEDSHTGFYADGSSITANAKTLLDVIARVVEGKDGNEYVDCGYNTYRMLNDDGTLGDLVCAGVDRVIGNEDDLTNSIIVLDQDLIFNEKNYGHLFLCPAAGSYKYQGMNVQGDKLLGTADDVSIYYTGAIKDFPEQTQGTLSEHGADMVTLTAAAVSSTVGHTAKVDNAAKTITVQPYDTVDFTTSVTLSGTPIANQKVKWKTSQIGDASIMLSETSAKTAKLSVSGTPQTGTMFTVQAISEEDPSVQSDVYTVVIEGPSTVTILQNGTEITDTILASKTTTTTFTATVKAADGSLYAVQDVLWSIAGKQETGTSITSNGILTIATGEDPKTELSITAKSKCDQSIIKTIKVNPKSIFDGITVGSTTTVAIDGTQFYVLAKDTANDQYLIFATDPVAQSIFGSTRQWSTTCTAYTTLKTWLNTKPTLSKKAQQTTVYTRLDCEASSAVTATTCDIFLLSEADLFGTANGQAVQEKKEYTYNNQKLPVNNAIIGFTDAAYGVEYSNKYWYYLRSPRLNQSGTAGVAFVANDTTQGSVTMFAQVLYGLRPALWVKGL